MFTPKQQGPDPAIQEAVKRITRVELTPLEEQLFKGWMAANGMDEAIDSPDHPIDFRSIYQQTNGKVLPPGQLQRQTEKQADIQTIMQAQDAHDSASPIQALMDGFDNQSGF